MQGPAVECSVSLCAPAWPERASQPVSTGMRVTFDEGTEDLKAEELKEREEREGDAVGIEVLAAQA